MKKYRLLGPDGFYESSTKGLLGGHKKLKIYGRLDCPNALRYLAKGKYKEHRVFFANEASALACGFRPCYYCSREAYRKWKAGQPDGDLGRRPQMEAGESGCPLGLLDKPEAKS